MVLWFQVDIVLCVMTALDLICVYDKNCHYSNQASTATKMGIQIEPLV